MKKSIAWHKDCLQNKKVFMQRLKIEINRLTVKITEEKDYITFYELQIKEAEKQNKDGFDRERFLKQRSNKALKSTEKALVV